MKILHYLIIVVCLIVIFASSNVVLATQEIFPVANNGETYKINAQAAWKDWSPVSDILVASVDHSLIEYAGNGTQLGILYENQNFSVSNIRFNHDGTKIAFLNDYTSSDGPLDIYVLNLQNNNLSQLTHGYHVQGLAWTPDDNIIYSENNPKLWEQFNISKLDLKNNSTYRILDHVADLAGFDVSPDGTKMVLAKSYTGEDCSHVSPRISRCYTPLFVYDLGSQNKTYIEIAKTPSQKSGPRWSPDGSFITYSMINDDCGSINAITPDGRNETILIPAANVPPYNELRCNELEVLNKDQTIIAYDSNLGASDGGMFFTYTDRCTNSSCQFPSIPEFPFVIPILLISIISVIVFYRIKFRK